MRSSLEGIVRRLVDAVPELRPLLQENTDEIDGRVLTYPFLADVAGLVQAWATDQVDSSELRVRRILGLLEASFRIGDSDLDDLISLGFVENLEHRGRSYQIVRSSLGPGLLAELERYEQA